MNWYKILKNASVSGEFWITDNGNAIDASGIGDYNHEAYAIETAQSQLADGDDYENWKHQEALKILQEEKKQLEDAKMESESEDTSQIDKALYEIWEKTRNIDYHAYEILTDNALAIGLDIEIFDIAEGHGDARLYAIKKLGWKRLQGDNVETWNLTSQDLRTIANGLYEAYYEDVENQTFNIYVYSNKTWFNEVPYEVIESRDISSLKSLQHRGW